MSWLDRLLGRSAPEPRTLPPLDEVFPPSSAAVSPVPALPERNPAATPLPALTLARAVRSRAGRLVVSELHRIEAGMAGNASSSIRATLSDGATTIQLELIDYLHGFSCQAGAGRVAVEAVAAGKLPRLIGASASLTARVSRVGSSWAAIGTGDGIRFVLFWVADRCKVLLTTSASTAEAELLAAAAVVDQARLAGAVRAQARRARPPSPTPIP